MKVYLIITAVLTVILIVLPVVMWNIPFSETEETYIVSETASTALTPQAEETTSKSDTVKVLRVNSGNIAETEVFDYIVGVVASEMPPTYEKEAIKAQCVVSYTYLKWIMENADNSSFENADITDSSSKHQGYMNYGELKDKWQDKYDVYISKIKECVKETEGQYLTYEGKPILACYHSLSPGKTESAKNVWKKDLPYLQSVNAPGDKLSPDIDSTVTFSKDEFNKICEKLSGKSNKSGDIFENLTATETGFVKSITIYGKDFDGNDVRSAFSLKSPYFTIEKDKDNYVFKIKGYGHGLGMSQYSADYMARQGSSYDEILKHFYKGVQINKS